MMTLYEKEFVQQFCEHYPEMAAGQVIEKLIEIGVVDFTRCKVLAIRSFIDREVKRGTGKIDALWMAAERFACSYEYARKCAYYYRDVNMR